MTDRSEKWDDKVKNPFKDIIDYLEKLVKSNRHKYYQKKYWKYTEKITCEDMGLDDSNPNHMVANTTKTTIGLFYRPIQKIIDTCNRIYELRLPRYNLNNTFPLDEYGFTKITHSLLLEHGRYYSDGPLLFENIRDVKFISKNNQGLVLHVDLYRKKGHQACVFIKNAENIVITGITFISHWKK